MCTSYGTKTVQPRLPIKTKSFGHRTNKNRVSRISGENRNSRRAYDWLRSENLPAEGTQSGFPAIETDLRICEILKRS